MNKASAILRAFTGRALEVHASWRLNAAAVAASPVKAAAMAEATAAMAEATAAEEAGLAEAAVEAVMVEAAPIMAEAIVIEPTMFMETKAMPVIEIAAKERIVIEAIVGVGAVGDVAAIVGAGRRAEAEPDQQHGRPRQPF